MKQFIIGVLLGLASPCFAQTLMSQDVYREYDENRHLLMREKDNQELYFPLKGKLVTLSSILDRIDKLERKIK